MTYDVFISAKSADYESARKVFEFLESHGLAVFLSDKSLPSLGSSDYRKEIDRALDQAKHMVVVTSSTENVVAPYVEAEWGLFINEKRSGHKLGNLVTLVAGDIGPSDLPASLRYYEVLPLRPESLERLLHYVGKKAQLLRPQVAQRAGSSPALRAVKNASRTEGQTLLSDAPSPIPAASMQPPTADRDVKESELKKQRAEVKRLTKRAKTGNVEALCSIGNCYRDGRGVDRDPAKAVDFYRQAATRTWNAASLLNASLAEAPYNLAVCYATGTGVVQNTSEAARWFRRAAALGHAFADYALAFHRTGTVGDDAQAVAFYREAAEKGDAKAQTNMGLCYEQGKGVQADDDEMVTWYRKAAEQGYAAAQFALGRCFAGAGGVKWDMAKAVEWFDKAVAQGGPAEQFRFGALHEWGHSCMERDIAAAVRWYSLAAEQGYGDALTQLGMMYVLGQGVPKDDAKATSLLVAAATQEGAGALFELGKLFELGFGTPKDEKEAVRLILLAAEGGCVEAQKEAALHCQTGRVIARDEAASYKWYRKAAEQGDASAQYTLGLKTFNSDETEACFWFRKAAEQGHADAQEQLGECYEDGFGVTEDKTTAREWYQKAADQGHKLARARLKRLLR